MHNMRSFLLVTVAALAIPACTQDIGGGSTGDDGSNSPTCGNGVVDTGETCDDGNTASGDGCSSTCQTETSAVPAIVGSMNPVVVELTNPNVATLNLTAQGGFTGTANITYTLLDASNAPITTATIAGPATADLSSGTAAVAVNVSIPMANCPAPCGTAIAGYLKADVTATGVTALSVMAAADIEPRFTITYVEGTGTTVAKHASIAQTYTVVRGTVIRFHNDDSTSQHVIHGDGAFPHQDPRNLATTQVKGDNYDVPTIGISPGATGQLGCHNHGTPTYSTFTVM